MKYTKSALGLLNAQYRSVLKKCLLINLGLFVLAAPAMAADTWGDAITGTNTFMDTLEAGGWNPGTDPVTGWGVQQVLGIMQGAANNTDAVIAAVNNTTTGLAATNTLANTNKGAIETLNGDASTTGSVANTIANATIAQNQVDGLSTTLAGKQATLSGEQLAAVNSGITAGKVATYDAYATTKVDTTAFNTYQTTVQTALDAKANAADLANYVKTDLSNLAADKQNAINSGITATDVAQITTNKNDIATINASAVMTSGITAADVTKLNGIETGAQVNTIETIKVNGSALTPDTDKAVNITVAEGATNGTIAVNGADVAVHGLGTAAYAATTDFDAAGTAAGLIAALDATESQTAGADGLALSITQTDGVITAISGSIAANTYDAYGAAAAVQGETTETVKSVNDKVTLLTTGTDTGVLNVATANVGGTATVGSLVATNGIQAGASNAFTVSNAGALTNVAGITSQGDITSTGDIKTTNGTISGKTGSFSGDLGVTGTTTTGTLAVTNNATVGGTLAVTGATTLTGALNGTTATFTGAVSTGALSSNGLDAGSGDITTTGALSAGAATVTSLDAGSGTIKTTGALQGGTLAVTTDATVGGDFSVGGAATITGALSAGATTVSSLKIGSSTAVTSVDDGSAALTSGNATTLASTATVLKSAENADYTGTTVKGAAATTDTISEAIDTTTSALNNVLITDGSKVDDAKVYVEWNGSDSNLATVLGDGAYTSTNNIAAGDSVTAALSKVDTAIGDRNSYAHAYNITKNDAVAKSLNDLDTAIGNRSAMANNAGADYTTALAGKDIASAITQVASNIGGATSAAKGNIASTATVNANLDTLDAAIGDRTAFSVGAGVDYTTTGLNNKDMVNAVSQVASNIGGATTAANGNIASTATVNANLDTLDTAIGNRAIASANNDINTATANSVSEGLAMVGDKIGTMDFSGTQYVSGSNDLTSAVKTLDSNIARVDNDVRKLKHEFNSGMASMAAMTALVPNSRSQGNTSLSLGTGAYNGHTAMAIGGFHYLTDNILLNAGASWGNSNDMAYRLGVTWSF